jgi:hypothetical protein
MQGITHKIIRSGLVTQVMLGGAFYGFLKGNVGHCREY